MLMPKLAKSLQSQRTEINCFKKFADIFKKNKKRTNRKRQTKNTRTMTAKTQSYSDFQT
jgi:hypothetical protein